jgi:hypothetical protein
MKFVKKQWIIVSSVFCLLVCIADLLMLYFLGKQYPGYNQLTDTISSLGASASPVGSIQSAWWIIIGIVFINFAICFGTVFSEFGMKSAVAAWLIALYGLGEGLGSGLFRADHVDNLPTLSATIHNIMGGIGVMAILILPLVMQKIFKKEKHNALFVFSWVIFVLGILTSFLFLFRYFGNNILSLYKGLWQRMTLIVFYSYLGVIAFMIMKKQNKPSS